MGDPIVTKRKEETPDPCRGQIMAALKKAIIAAAHSGGKAAYDLLVGTWNAFIGLIQTMAAGVITVLKPLLLIDVFVYETFIAPPLKEVISIGEKIKQSVRIPAAASGLESNSCESTKAASRAIKRIEEFGTKDFDKLKNWVDSMSYFFQRQKEIVDSLDKLPELLDGLKITSTFEDFLESKEIVFGGLPA